MSQINNIQTWFLAESRLETTSDGAMGIRHQGLAARISHRVEQPDRSERQSARRIGRLQS